MLVVAAEFPFGPLGPADSDDDGVYDFEERFFNTDPNNFDSDGDGWSDGDEIFGYGTDPLFADAHPPDDVGLDSDFDGIPDFEEIEIFGTDPLLVDTDGDGWSDSEELFEYGTDPLNFDDFPLDSDSDGIQDEEEILIYGTDPNLADTDGGDVCRCS